MNKGNNPAGYEISHACQTLWSNLMGFLALVALTHAHAHTRAGGRAHAHAHTLCILNTVSVNKSFSPEDALTLCQQTQSISLLFFQWDDSSCCCIDVI